MEKVAMVTGGTKGIGFGIVNELYEEGYKVACLGRTENYEVKNLIKSSDGMVKFISTDLYDVHKIRSSVEEVVKEFGRIDVLVNNAGVAPKERNDILDTTTDSFDFVINTNLRGTYFMTQAVSNIMVEQEKEDYPFKIINI